MNAKDKEIINILLKIARICGTFPTEKPSRRFYVYQCLIFICNLFFITFGMYRNLSNYYRDSNTLNIFMDVMTSSLVGLQGLSYQLLCLCYPERCRKFYRKLKMVFDKTTTTTNKTGVYLEMFALHAVFLLKVFLLFWIWVPVVGIEINLNYSFRILNDYYTMVSVLLLVHINIVLKERFILMNAFLQRSNCVRYVQKVYGKTIRLIEDFNSIFGYHILLLMAFLIFLSLESLNNIFWFLDYTKSDSPKILFWYSFHITSIIVTINGIKESN